jgi:hypothetical protein
VTGLLAAVSSYVDPDMFSPSTRWILAGLSALSVVAGVTQDLVGRTGVASENTGEDITPAQRTAIGDALREARGKAASDAGIPERLLGVSAHEVRPEGGGLRRIGRERITDYGKSDIRWTRGKGAVGECWRTGRPVYRDLMNLLRRHRGCSRDRFEAASGIVRQGFDYDEFCILEAKYAEVYCEPIRDETDALIGVIVLDVLRSDSVTPARALDSFAVRTIAVDAANTVAHILTEGTRPA